LIDYYYCYNSFQAQKKNQFNFSIHKFFNVLHILKWLDALLSRATPAFANQKEKRWVFWEGLKRLIGAISLM
jgi:hypothetical protein